MVSHGIYCPSLTGFNNCKKHAESKTAPAIQQGLELLERTGNTGSAHEDSARALLDQIFYAVGDADDLVIEARVSPLDIDVVHPGLAATVHLSAFSQRNLPRIEGEVTSVSADALTDENSNETYFRATVEVPADELAALGEGIELAPGMPAEVLIVTGERTMADYLTEPLANSLRRAFREN